MNLGPYAAFIIGAFAVAIGVIAGMIIWVWLDYRQQLRMLAKLEARGVTRRSDPSSEGKKSP
jgi:heme exporter protein D